jgi:hypothetical protein
MGSINLGRVLMGGLLTGLIINVGEFILNVPILGATYEAALADAGLQTSPSEMVIWPLYAFAMGILAVWVYAAIRPRFGPGVRTAVYAGLVIWFAILGTFLAQGLTLPVVPSSILWISLVWGLVEIPVATVAGAWVYREE